MTDFKAPKPEHNDPEKTVNEMRPPLEVLLGEIKDHTKEIKDCVKWFKSQAVQGKLKYPPNYEK